MAAGFESDIKARQDAFSGIKDNVEMVGEMLESGKFDWAKLETYGSALTQHASVLENHFPEGSQAGSDAKAAIWKNYDKFSMGLEKLNTGFNTFYTAAKAQDQAALVAGFKDATGTCKACHRKFRAK
nr:cytochrome c [Vibrio sp. 99-8-1]